MCLRRRRGGNPTGSGVSPPLARQEAILLGARGTAKPVGSDLARRSLLSQPAHLHRNVIFKVGSVASSLEHHSSVTHDAFKRSLFFQPQMQSETQTMSTFFVRPPRRSRMTLQGNGGMIEGASIAIRIG